MPLKHLTETLLILVLAVLTVLAGIVVSVLPPLPSGWLPWGVVLAIALAYPIALAAFLRRNRADNAFRVLHLLPAGIVVLWALLQLLASYVPYASSILTGFLWGHAAIPVLLALTVLAAFCLHVIRRRVPRLAGLGVLAAIFAGFVVLSQDRGWGTQLAGVVGGTGKIASSAQASSKNLAPSSVPAEEEWRQKLRDVESKSSSSPSGSSVSIGAVSSVSSRSSALSSRPAIADATPPNRLPTSGFGAESIATLFVAGYCGVLHRRAAKRVIG